MIGDDNPFSAPLGPVPASPAPGVYEGRFRGHHLRYWIEGDALHVDEGLLRIAVPLHHPEVRLINRRVAYPMAVACGVILVATAAIIWAFGPRMGLHSAFYALFGVALICLSTGRCVAVGSRKRHIIVRLLDRDRDRFDAFVGQLRERIRPGG